jgi:hypothetical protein
MVIRVLGGLKEKLIYFSFNLVLTKQAFRVFL